jgi:hypothetical protein
MKIKVLACSTKNYVIKSAMEVGGSTSLSQIPLSYRWIINDAKVLLINHLKLKSPEFSLKVPFAVQTKHGEFSLFAVQTKHGDSTSPGMSSWHALISWGKGLEPPHLTFCLCQGTIPFPKSASSSITDSTVLISECVFTILHPETKGVLYSTTPPKEVPQCEIDNYLKTCCSVDSTITSSNIDKYLYTGVLTLEITATILCIGKPIESKRICQVPPDNFREKVHILYKDEVLTDVVIQSGKEEFKVHKAILASQSPVFRKMFEVDMEEKRSGVLTITDLSPAVVSDLVAYFYTGTAPNIHTLTRDLLNAAKKYELSRLHTMCENELKKRVCVANVVEMIFLADLYEALSLKQECLKFIHLNLNSVKKTRQWEDLKQDGTLLMEIFEYNFDGQFEEDQPQLKGPKSLFNYKQPDQHLH